MKIVMLEIFQNYESKFREAHDKPAKTSSVLLWISPISILLNSSISLLILLQESLNEKNICFQMQTSV